MNNLLLFIALIIQMSAIEASYYDSQPCWAPDDHSFTEIAIGIQHFPMGYDLCIQLGAYFPLKENEIIYTKTGEVDEQKIIFRIYTGWDGISVWSNLVWA